MAKFNVRQYLRDLGSDLVRDFDKSSRSSHPSHIGAIKETAARQKLEALLPGFVGVGEGFVIDTLGGESRQSDLVLYEKYECSMFNLGTPGSTYFPCEGVCAVGEVKTELTLAELRDSYEKIASVKRLKRNVSRPAFRKYGSTTTMCDEPTSQQVPENPHFQIYGFILCQKFGAQVGTMLKNMAGLDAELPWIHRPNMVVSLEDGIMVRCKSSDETKESQIVWGAAEANAIVHGSLGTDTFGFLVDYIVRYITFGVTTADLPIKSYLALDGFTVTQGVPIPEATATQMTVPAPQDSR